MLLASDGEGAASKAIGVGLMSFPEVYDSLRPDVVVLLGDRFELLAPAIAALIHRIPIAHVHGGETSQGAIDEAVRHAITKMATFHFPATEVYKQRILQMGEPSERVFNCGSPGIDLLYREVLLSREELRSFLDLDLEGGVALVTFHPATLEGGCAAAQVEHLLRAIDGSGLKAVFTKANADPEGNVVNRAISKFCDSQPERFRLFDHLGPRTYHSCLKHLDLMIGNSSSGLVEAPSFGMPVVNVGDRQRGRVRARNVIDVGTSAEEIEMGIEKARSTEFTAGLRGLKNPYDEAGDGRASHRIKETLKHLVIDPSVLKKQFITLKEAAL
jgi:UDP-N-acetylglucosamine 2-epimerase (non-hydrolysing)/GDP/UDP-N,N'-diacetylbacillosamine 2-epimerase (hydrolysing)